MRKCTALLATLILTLSLLPGCPGAGSPLVGTWRLAWGMAEYGVELLPDGTATSFMIDGVFEGTLRWWENGDQLVINQDFGPTRILFTGSVQNSSTYVEGLSLVWDSANPGTTTSWYANKQ